MPSSGLILTVIFTLLDLSLGFEKKRTFLSSPSILILAEIRLAMQFGSGRAEFDEGWTVQVCPISAVTATALPFVAPLSALFRSSRILSIRLPSDSCTTCASVVFDFAPVPIAHVSHPSLL